MENYEIYPMVYSNLYSHLHLQPKLNPVELFETAGFVKFEQFNCNIPIRINIFAIRIPTNIFVFVFTLSVVITLLLLRRYKN